MSSVVSLLVLGATAALAPPATALQIDPSVVAGRQLPLVPKPFSGYLGVDAGAPGYVAYDMEQPDDYADPQQVIRRTSDGSVVRSVSATTPAPMMSTGGVVTREPVTGSPGLGVVVHDIESGAVTWSVAMPTDETFVAAGASWVLTTQGTAGGGQAVLRRPGADPLVLPGVDLSAPNSSGPGTTASASTLVIHDMGRIWAVSLATGAVQQLTTGAGWYDQVVLTPHRVLWIDTGNGQSATVTWDGVDGSNPGSVVVPDTAGVGPWVGFGDRLAVLRQEPGDDLYSQHLEPIDLTTGTRGAAVAADVGTVRSDDDGTVVVTPGEGQTGRVATVADDGQPVHVVADFPVVGRPATALALSGDNLVAGFGDAFDPGAGPALTTTPGGTGTWSSSLAPGDPALPGAPVSAAGDVVETQTSHDSAAPAFTVTWPGGHRDLPSLAGGWKLARGGQVVIGNTDPVEIDDSRTGDALHTMPVGAPFAVDGKTLWMGPDSRGNLVSVGLGGRAPSRSVPSGLRSCTSPRLQVAGRFALVECSSDSYTAIDLSGILAPQAVTGAAQPQLGNGFVAWIRNETDSEGTTYPVVQVQNLGPGGGTRSYGPLHGKTAPPFPMLAVDDGDAPRLAYVDTTDQPRVVDLDWLTAAPTTWDDHAAPTLDPLTGSPRTGGATVSVTWGATDTTDAAGQLPSGVATYDVRYEQGPAGGPYDAWVLPPELQATTEKTTSLVAQPGQDTCFSVRATDRNGNTSDWSDPWCSAVDGTPPALSSVGGSPRTAPTRQVDFTWAYADPSLGTGVPGSGVASYDVRYQQAPKVGAAYGPWTSPATWQGTTTAAVSLTAAPGVDTCFQVRARDEQGNLSEWSASRCSAVDSTAPGIVAADVGPLIVSATRPTVVTFSYRGTDNAALATYDVGYRYAPPGGALGPLTFPAVWQAVTATSQKATVAVGGEICFVVRAHDRVGNASPWTYPRCATVPYDDRALPGTNVFRGVSRYALSGTVTRLNAAGSSLRTATQHGSRLALVVVRGPRQGAVDVYAGSHVVGRVYLSASSWRRDVVMLPTYAFAAPITIRSVSSAPSLIDALTIIR